MLRYFINTLLPLALALAMAACANEEIPTGPGASGEGNVTLTFRNARQGSRAVADDDNNEDAISSLHVFLYRDDAGDDAAPEASQVFTGLTEQQQATVKMNIDKAVTERLFGSLEATGTCRMVALANLPASVTVPENATVSQLRAIGVTAEFATKKVQDSFVMFGDTDEERSGNVEVTFTPDDKGGSASGNVMLVRAAARINLNVRLPEKIEMEGDNATLAGTWTPLTEGMQVLMANGVHTSIADPSSTEALPADEAYFSITTASVGNDPYRFVENAEADHENGYPWQMPVPLYTYPNKWKQDPSEPHRTYLTLIVPFAKDGENETFRTCYYSVPVTAEAFQLLRNTAYTINLNVNMLGSFSPDEPLEIEEASYLTVDWADVETSVEIKDHRYLVVNQNQYTLENQSSISIPFYTSHTVEVSSITMSYKRFNAVTGTNGEVVDITVTDDQNTKSADNNNGKGIFSYRLEKDVSGNNVLVIDHELVPWIPKNTNGVTISETGYSNETAAKSALNGALYYSPGTGAAYSPYVFTVTIKHSDQNDGSVWERTMTVTQNPGMWIYADRNDGTSGNGSAAGRVFLNYGPYLSWSWSNRNGWTSTQQSARNDYTSTLGGANGLSSDGNKNTNMYVITINTLSEGTNYIIDDPRTFYTENNLDYDGSMPVLTGNGSPAPNSIDDYSELSSFLGKTRTAGWCAKAPALYPKDGPDRGLTYYYPTRESDNYSMVVAPKIRVASSYGVCNTGRSRTQARRRCATYQEQDRPAGRWRVPTLGEMQFIVNLSQTNKIPTLFSKGAHYYSAQGPVEIPTGDDEVTLKVSTTTWNNMSVRCVYDEWYWEKFPEYSINKDTGYRLGDMPKQNPEEGTH